MSGDCRILHIVYRLDFGGMENGLVNLVNGLPADRYSHSILCLTGATEFRERIVQSGVEIIECGKPAGKHLPTYWRVFRAIRALAPDIVHTRNLGTIDMAWAAWLAGVPRRVHSEHGWSPEDPRGRSGKYRLLRRLCDPAITGYVAVSNDIRSWLCNVIGIAEGKVQTLHNGVCLERFAPPSAGGQASARQRGATDRVVFGTLGRQEPIKGLETFLQAVRGLVERRPEMRERIRVVMAGDGPQREQYMRLATEYGLAAMVEFPGMVSDPAGFLHDLDFFVQPSLNEGISNTVLEAMASGLPVIATDVGGNPELVRNGYEGCLVPPGDAAALSQALETYISDATLRQRQGEAARSRAETEFSIQMMLNRYDRFYSGLCPRAETSTPG